MKNLFVAACLAALTFSPMLATSGDAPGQRVSFEFKDQYQQTMTLKPVFPKPMIVTVADKKGSKQLLQWIEPLTDEFGQSVDFFPIADLRAVPGPLKGLIRRSFKKNFEYNVAMDWDGVAVERLASKPDRANLMLLNRQGQVVASVHGEASAENLQKMIAAIRTDFEARQNTSNKPTDDTDQ